MSTPPPLSPQNPPDDNTISSIIPYRNAPALFAYYCGVFGLIPCLGALLGPAAFILGIIGLKTAARQPTAKGKVHAWIGIVLGALITVLHLVLVVVALMQRNSP